MSLQDWLIQFGTHHIVLIYVVIVAIALFEGPILSVLLGIVLRVSNIYFLPVYIAVILGDLIGDTIWYHVGKKYGVTVIKKIKKYFSVTEEKIDKAKALFHNNKYKILFISKITNGLGFSIVILITAGIVRIPFWKFIRTNFAGQVLWSGALLALGYFFGELYNDIHSILGKAFLIGVCVALGFFAFAYIKSLRKRFVD